MQGFRRRTTSLRTTCRGRDSMALMEVDQFGRMLCSDGHHDWHLISKPGEVKCWKCSGCVEMKFEAIISTRLPPDDHQYYEEYILNPDPLAGGALLIRKNQTKH
jgi:hypothetical protein